VLEDYPPYRIIKYYYSDQTVSNIFDESKDYTKVHVIATLILCINGSTYISINGGTPIIPDRYLDDIVYSSNWLNIKSVEYCINYQPYNIDKWNKNKGTIYLFNLIPINYINKIRKV